MDETKEKQNTLDELIELLEDLPKAQARKSFDHNFKFYDETLRPLGVFLDRNNLTEEQKYYIQNIPALNYYLDIKREPSRQAVNKLIKYVQRQQKIWGKKVTVTSIKETHCRIDGTSHIKNRTYGLQLINYIGILKEKYDVGSFFNFILYDVRYSIIIQRKLFGRDFKKYKKWTGLSNAYKKHYYPRFWFMRHDKEDKAISNLTTFPHKKRKIFDKKYDKHQNYRRKYNFPKQKSLEKTNTLQPLDCSYEEFIDILKAQRDK